MVSEKTIQIGNRKIGYNQPCFIIAEAGINHNGSIEIAKKMIDVAKDSGVDAIKFQTFRAKDIADPALTYTYISQGKEVTEPQLQMFQRYEFQRKDWEEIAEYCKEKNILFFSTPQNIPDLEILLEIGIPIIKVGSDDLTNLPLLDNYSRRNLPMSISTGMAYTSEIDEAVRTIAQNNKELIILHCVSSYPASPEEINLSKIKTLKTAYPKYVIGFSDHSSGCNAVIGAVVLEAKVVEKHFTLDHALPGPDHRFSADPTELKQLVEGIRYLEKAIGSSELGPTPQELKMRALARRSVISSRDIAEGEELTAENLTLKRPGTGLPPKFLKYFIGKKAKTALKVNELLSFDKIK